MQRFEEIPEMKPVTFTEELEHLRGELSRRVQDRNHVDNAMDGALSEMLQEHSGCVKDLESKIAGGLESTGEHE